MKRSTAVVFVLSLVLMGQPAWAVRTAVHEAAESQEYGRKFGGMLGRGVLNAATFFVDILVNTVNDTKAGPPLVGTLTGVAKGVGCGALRLGSGAVDLVTFWVPGFNGFPVSDSYENCFAVGSGIASSTLPAMGEPEGASASTISPESATIQVAGPNELAKRTWKK